MIAMNEAEVGAEALADFGLLESAVLRPQTTIGGVDAYASIHEKAAALMHSLIRNHPVGDGNKRTAVVAAFTFYLLNGWEIRTQDSDVVALRSTSPRANWTSRRSLSGSPAGPPTFAFPTSSRAERAGRPFPEPRSSNKPGAVQSPSRRPG